MMKKVMMMAAVITMLASSNVYAREIGEYERSNILKGTYEVVDLNSKATLSEWSEPDLFGNQYRLFTYKTGDTEEVVCLKYHTTKEERKLLKAAKKK